VSRSTISLIGGVSLEAVLAFDRASLAMLREEENAGGVTGGELWSVRRGSTETGTAGFFVDAFSAPLRFEFTPLPVEVPDLVPTVALLADESCFPPLPGSVVFGAGFLAALLALEELCLGF
jgi:hypothetical protein